MSTASYYLQQLMNTSGVQNKDIAAILAEIGGDVNKTQDNYTPAEKIAVTQPQLRTIAQYLQEMGVDEGAYTYDYNKILDLLNAGSAAGQAAQQNELQNAARDYNVQMATQQQSAADTLRQLSAQAIQSGMTRGVQSANLLSTLLGTSQQAAEGAQELAAQRVQAAQDYAAELAGNASSALTTSNAATQQLLGNIRQLYNDDIQQKTADLEYNASLEETLANYMAQKYVSDTNYSATQHSTAVSGWNQLQAALAQMAGQAAAAEAQDNYSAAYLAAQEAARSSYYGGGSSGGSSGGTSSGGTTGTTSGATTSGAVKSAVQAGAAAGAKAAATTAAASAIKAGAAAGAVQVASNAKSSAGMPTNIPAYSATQYQKYLNMLKK